MGSRAGIEPRYRSSEGLSLSLLQADILRQSDFQYLRKRHVGCCYLLDHCLYLRKCLWRERNFAQ